MKRVMSGWLSFAFCWALLMGIILTTGGQAMAFTVKSSAFQAGGEIPVRYTCDGKDISPDLAWSGAPEGTKSFVVICDDPDAPVGTWVHWVIYNIPSQTTSLPKGVPTIRELPDGSRQGVNDFHRIGYGGPCPPKGPAHRYFFKIYALDTKLNLSSGATKKQLIDTMKGHILGETHLMGRYKR